MRHKFMVRIVIEMEFFRSSERPHESLGEIAPAEYLSEHLKKETYTLRVSQKPARKC